MGCGAGWKLGYGLNKWFRGALPFLHWGNIGDIDELGSASCKKWHPDNGDQFDLGLGDGRKIEGFIREDLESFVFGCIAKNIRFVFRAGRKFLFARKVSIVEFWLGVCTYSKGILRLLPGG